MRRSHQLIRTYTLRLATVGLLSAAANAQLLNVDFSDPNVGTTLDCAPTYAAAGSAGVWNSITPHGAPVGLVDKSGAATSVTMTESTGMGGCWNFPNSAYIGEDANLMQDFTYGGPGTSEWIEFSGLNNGTYIVYTYAQATDLPLDVTAVDCTESTDGIQNVGGALWPGFHQQFGSYARHTAIVTNGTLHIDISSVNGGYPSLNGFQLESGGFGTNYCLSTVNSTGAASTISASGSASIAANDLVLSADGLPSQPGIFIAGPGQAQLPFFNGFLCVAQMGLQRFDDTTAPAGGVISEAVDFATSAPGGLNVMAGSNYYFQRWNRDPAAGGGNANFSDGIEILIEP
jgi:hypothetical protein